MGQDEKQESANALEPARTYGMSQKEVDSLRKYVNDGMPGIGSVRDDQIESMLKMYMDGCTYAEISMKTFVKKDAVLFLAYKHGWFSKRQERVADLVESLDHKIGMIRLESSEFIVDVARFLHEYIRDRIKTYERTKDPKVLNGTKWNLLNHYYKCVDIMKGSPEPQQPGAVQGPQSPNVSIYAADGSTVNLGKEAENSSVDHATLLKFFADLERAKEQQQNDKNRKEK